MSSVSNASNVPKRWLKQHQRHLKNLIDAEMRFTKEVEDNQELISNRLMMMEMYWLGGSEFLSTMKINKRHGVINASDDEMVKAYVELSNKKGEKWTREKLELLIENFEDSLTTSKYKEKFYRYAHNFNMEKSKKYHAKLNDNSIEQLEKMRVSVAEGGGCVLGIDNAINNSKDEYSSGEDAYLKYADQIKTANKIREDMLIMMEIKMRGE